MLALSTREKISTLESVRLVEDARHDNAAAVLRQER